MLDFTKLSSAFAQYKSDLPKSDQIYRDRQKRLVEAYKKAGKDHKKLVAKAENDRQTLTWNFGIPDSPLSSGNKIYKPNEGYAVVATDGSNVDLDPHDNPDFYALNVGITSFQYGTTPAAKIWSEPQVITDPDKLWIGEGSNLRPKTGVDISLERDLLEMEALVRVAREMPNDLPRVALVDGSLIRWSIETVDEDVRDPFLKKYLKALDELHELGVMVAGYIAASQSRELVNFLRLTECPFQPAKCKGCAAPCNVLSGAVDADLMYEILKPGEYGPILRSTSRILERYRDHVIHSTTLRSKSSVVRIEMPISVFDDGNLEMLLGVILDQIEKGDGYPPILQEAHEAAVISTQDRSSLQIVMEQMAGRQLISQKARSKRLKRV